MLKGARSSVRQAVACPLDDEHLTGGLADCSRDRRSEIERQVRESPVDVLLADAKLDGLVIHGVLSEPQETGRRDR
jgi:hypothetical protein